MDKENISDVYNKPVEDYEVSLLPYGSTKTSFAWKHFGALVLKDGNKKVAIAQSKVFCQFCLKAAQKTSESEGNGEKFSRFVFYYYNIIKFALYLWYAKI